ncbi:hypothetical protein CORC01_02015 [Colletotrichum orchidophilum]|uniref:Uncharacterized protein n=1 Tax=Colletotrichum orchidophilum TaxID=1209926 RepID=A0A1G4BMD6_9PEZI|nr:uncharacterized protein CORC01_02015 [Colletotrichum orchidophilum]OHF02619.1 hypothetical protein CORC01_02015 [Colletotrichum orchidophilum]
MAASNQQQARKGSKRMTRREIDQPVLLVPVPIFCAPAPAVLRLRDPVCPLLTQVQSNVRVQVPAKGSSTSRATGRRPDGLVRIGYPTCRSGCRPGSGSGFPGGAVLGLCTSQPRSPYGYCSRAGFADGLVLGWCRWLLRWRLSFCPSSPGVQRYSNLDQQWQAKHE